MRAVFRADASIDIGTGHVMRCLALAHTLKQRGAEILFVSREHLGNLCDLISAEGFAIVRLPLDPVFREVNRGQFNCPSHAPWLGTSWEEDARLTIRAIEKWGSADWLVVDHYALDVQWEDALHLVCNQIMVIDDLADRHHHCDLLLDQNFIGGREKRYDEFVPPTCRKLLGPEFALLRPEFAAARGSIPTRKGGVRRILIFVGGSDPGNVTRMAIDSVLSLSCTDIDVDVVVGATNPNRNEIEQVCSSRSSLHFHCQISNMAELIAVADLAIVGGGTVLLECCALALPAVVLAVADNQLPGARVLAENGGAILLGKSADISRKQLASTLEFVLNAPDLVRHMAHVAGQTTDGLGSHRVATNIDEGPISLRHAVADDSEAIWRWRNDATVRRFSVNSSLIETEEHRKWFGSVLGDPNRVIFIAENDKGALGVLRYDFAGHSATISVYLVPGREGSGLGTRLIRAGESWMRANRQEVTLILAEIGAGNEASIRAFTKAGFLPDRLVYLRNLQGA